MSALNVQGCIMAIWQYDLELVPREAACRRAGGVPTRAESLAASGRSVWESVKSIPDLESELSRILPLGKSWSRDIKMWGTYDGHRIDLVFDGGNLAQFLVRFDMRHPSRAFFHSVLRLASENSCVLLTDNGDILEPKASAVLAHLAQSDAMRFVKDPRGFLNQLTSEE